MANGQIDTPVGETPPCDIRVANTIVTLIFYIVKENAHPILLGLDWFGATGALISPAGDTPYIRLGRREIYLNSVGAEEIDVEDERDAIEEGRHRDIIIEDEEDFGLDPKETKPAVEIVPSVTLSPEQLEEFEKIIPLIKDRTTTGLHDIGLYTQDEMEIVVDDRTPLVEPQYSPPKKVQEMVLEDIELMIKYGILEESRGSYQSPLIAKLKGR